jgi:hypothetical protein
MKNAGILVASMLLLACTSNPYVTHTTVNETMNQRVESVCTHKTAFIPWYAVVAFGLFTFRYGHECHDEVSSLSEPSKYAEGTPSQDDPSKSAEKGTENNPCPSGQVMTNNLCESPAPVEQKVPISQPSSDENRVVPEQQ